MIRSAYVLHGGGGPATVAPVVDHLADSFEVRAPVHPGWSGTAPVPGDTIAALATRYLADLAARKDRDVILVGSSVGGWIAAEMAVHDAQNEIADRIVGRLVLIDAVGVDVPGATIRDFFALDPRGVAEYSWADPERGYIDPATRTPGQLAIMRGNMSALRSYAGDPYMHDPTLLKRLAGVAVPTLVLWGDADRIVTPAYGSAIAEAIPDAVFSVIRSAGHLPHIEQPGATLEALDAFVAASSDGEATACEVTACPAITQTAARAHSAPEAPPPARPAVERPSRSP